MATKNQKKATADAGADQETKPETVVLDAHYAFMADDGTVYAWREGQIVTDSEHIGLLIERDAPFTIKE